MSIKEIERRIEEARELLKPENRPFKHSETTRIAKALREIGILLLEIQHEYEARYRPYERASRRDGVLREATRLEKEEEQTSSKEDDAQPS